ncbi:MAG: HutD family protein, partial [Filifactor alocis]|nr:HutD family protein [Filifactor alocis]
MRVLSAKNYVTTKWSGGTTTQLYIYPEDSDYSKRNFSWRVSTARIDDETSDFTSLPGVKRWILPITGDLDLDVEGDKVHLKPFQTYCFDGGLPVRSSGRIRDFNLMLSEGWQGSVEVLEVHRSLRLKEGFYYLPPEQGDVRAVMIDDDGEELIAVQGNCIYMEEGEKEAIFDRACKVFFI